MKGDEKHAIIRNAAVAFAAFGGTSFRNADLTNANLQDTVFGGTNLYCTNLTDAKNINIDEIKQQPSFWSATYNKDMEAKLNLSDTQKENRESICKK